MQVVIDIPKEIKDFISGKRIVSDDTACDYLYELRKAVNNGIVLQEGHGRLVDADDIDNHIIGHVDTRSCPTIIEADNESEEDE